MTRPGPRSSEYGDPPGSRMVSPSSTRGGQWRDSEGQIKKERTKVLVILAPPGEDGLRLIGEISAEYKRRFSQQPVLQVVYDTCVTFA